MLTLDATFIFVFISFLIFVFLMKLICYKPIMKIIETREELYAKNQKTVDDTNIRMFEIEQNIEEKISKTKLESSKLLKEAGEKNKSEKESAIELKKEEIKTSINELQNTLEEQSKQAKNDLKNEMNNYVKCIVSKVLGVNFEDVHPDLSKSNELLK